MLTQIRQEKILELLQDKKAVTVIELCEIFKASESTIRRDLSTLDKEGKLKKVHGGATVLDGVFESEEEAVVDKAVRNVEEKRLIAKYAASLIKNDDFVYIDAGTTTESMIDFINAKKAVFVTNGITHARKLMQKGLKTYVLGGQLKASTEAVIGADGVNNLKKYNFTKCFIGTNGITHDKGYTTPDVEEALMKTEAMNRSYISYVLADNSKCGRVSAVTFAQIEKACIITDFINDERILEKTVVKSLINK